ncbi:MAG: FtsX-like permease family protein [Acidobacteriota bacterium]
MKKIFVPWTWKMAWRDSRSSRGRLLLFISSITLGVAALVAIRSFGANLQQAVDDQALTLLGADLVISSRDAFSAQSEELFSNIGVAQSRQISTSTMAYFPESSATRLVQLRALKGGFPYYGELETIPAEAGRTFQQGAYALVDHGLMIQLEIKVGQTVRIGTESFQVLGKLVQIPGEPPVASFVGPRIYIPHRFMERTGLIQVGSRLRYRIFFQLAPGEEAEKLEESLQGHLREHRLGSETVKERKESLGRSLENLTRFLSLAGFVALLLGGIGVASSIHLYLKQKINTVAVLRCLGAVSGQILAVYLLQAAFLGLLGALLGGFLGLGVQALIPNVLGDFLPVSIPVQISWTALLTGVVVGLGMALLFALLPLLPIRRVTPLLALRSEFEPPASRDRAQWLVCGLIALAVLLFALAQTESWAAGLWFFVGTAAVFGLLTASARLIMWLARRYFPHSWSYVWRQGLANLYRPHNQTVVMILALGLGTFLIATLFLVQDSLLGQMAGVVREDRPNLVFFDIQSDQLEGVRQEVRSQKLPILQDVAVVTMRLSSLKGEDVRQIIEGIPQRRTPGRRSRWPLLREYRSTYRDRLIDSEELLEGEWVGRADPDDGPVPVSLEEDIARSLRVKVGDEMVFDVQGIAVPVRVGSIRQVDWQRFQPAFFVVFPQGVLEEAPQFHVLVTRAPTVESSALLQRRVVASYPNVSAIDMALILKTVDGVLDKASFVIRFMALFSVLTGLIVLAGAIMTGRYQRIRESVLLRTLGASRRQVQRILLVEYLFLGSFAALTGLSLALAAGWGLAEFAFEVAYLPNPLPLAAAFLAVGGLTVAVGMFNSRGICDRPPLEVLRSEN